MIADRQLVTNLNHLVSCGYEAILLVNMWLQPARWTMLVTASLLQKCSQTSGEKQCIQYLSSSSASASHHCKSLFDVLEITTEVTACYSDVLTVVDDTQC